MRTLAVLLAGALGAGARFALDHAAARATVRLLPLGTLAVNVSGSAAAGVLVGLTIRHGLGDGARVVLGAGFLAAFTTYSTFAVETVRLAEQHAVRTAAWNVAAHVLAGTAAAWLGFALVALA